MYLDKLKIYGFKSFARKTTLSFAGGMTSIVGPNGCGKSNVVDAIRWVLGEQRAGTLRSDRMENVIFNGTKEMKPLGMAEVSLVIKNTRNVLPVEYTEVVITRRLFRSGESQYLLNNQVCRLKDINDLLMDTGMAADAYSVIELSMVEQILNGKPEERRRIFEEAAGISKYKQRRRISARKLESTEADLIRVEDILSEVENKVNSLRRQVRRAQRYQELTASLQEVEVRASTYKYSKIYEELDPLRQQLEEKQRERETSTAQVSFKEAELEALRTQLIEVEQELRTAQLNLNDINSAIRKKEEEILISRERVKSLEERNHRIEEDIRQLQQRVLEETKNVKSRTESLATLEKELTEGEARYQAEKTQLEKIEAEFKDKQEQGKRSAAAMRQFLEQISGYQGNIEHLKASLTFLNGRIQEISAEESAIQQRIARHEEELAEKRQKEQAIQQQLADMNTEFENTEQKSTDIKTAIETTKEAIANDRNNIQSLEQRIGIIKKLLESYDDYPEGVKHIMLQNKGYAGTLADVLSVPPDYRRAVEAVLGEAATYLIVESDEQAFLEIRELAAAQKGVVTFAPLKRITVKSSDKPNVPTDANVIGWADEIIQCDELYRSVVKSLLGDCLIVKDIAPYQNNGGINATVVSLSGEMITHWGGIKGGQKSKDDSGLIGRRDQLNKLHSNLKQTHDDIASHEKNRADLEQQLLSTTERISSLKAELAGIQKEFGTVTMNINQVNYQIEQAHERQKTIQTEKHDLERQIAEANIKIEKAHQELTDIQEQRSSADGDIATLNNELEVLNTKRDEAAQLVHQLQLDFVQKKNTVTNAKAEIERGQRFITDSNDSIKRKYADINDNERHHEQLSDRIESLTESLVEDYSKRETCETDVQGHEEQQAKLKEESEQRERIVRELRRERETFSESIHAMELRIAELKMQADNLFRRIGEEYSVDLKRAEFDPEYNVSTDEDEIEQIKDRLKNLGPVNLLALKEYDSEKERFDFLKSQQTDLIEAKQNLTETIAQINHTAQDKFQDVFSQIRTNFTNVFNKYFPDGEANLILTEGDDPLEGNIEIMANPKSKRPTALTLLSGGEKALTAISLLFAIYLVKPSPFCILDEVDAPLDDRNIQRFTASLDDFSQHTQFLIVTHNKLTMKAAKSLYGITMETPGVSKVVSVKME